MPLHGHHHTSSASAQHDHNASQGGGAFGGSFHGKQVADVCLPPGFWCTLINSGPVAADQESPYTPSANAPDMIFANKSNPSSGPGSSSAPVSAISNSSQSFEAPRRSQTYGRKPEELHIPSSSTSIGQQGSKDLPRHHSYHSPQEAGGVVAPGISVHQATPQGHHFSNTSGNTALPGALQPGRPGPPSINTAPSTIPTLPQASAQSQQNTPSARPSAGGHAHSYSRSSPAGMDQQKYVPFINTPESSKYASTPTHKYTSSQMPPGESPYSPLGLADIRPLADQGMGDGPSSANPYSNDSFPSIPTKSNYLAPWAVYAFDWCKWPVQQQNSNDGGGKMAIGSYVEDGHNFVSQSSLPGHNGQNTRKEDPLMHDLDPNT